MKILDQTRPLNQLRQQRVKSAGILLGLLMLAVQAGTTFGQIIPANRLTDWTPGVSAGVPGGIPTTRNTLIDVTKSPYNADKTGASDTTAAIQAAINAATSNQVVYLPAGTYRVNGTIALNQTRSGITVRGAGASTIINSYSTYITFNVGSGADYLWGYPSSGNQVTAGLTKGSTSLTIADTSAFAVGKMVQVSMANDPSIPVISVSGYDLLPNNQPMRRQKTMVTAKTSNTLTIWPPLYGDYSAVTNIVYTSSQQAMGIGIENLVINATNSTAFATVWFEQCVGCWLQNVKIQYSENYHVTFYDCLNCEMRHCWLDPLNHSGSNGAGLLFGTTSGTLVENNVIYQCGPCVEVNDGSCGNAFGYNFIVNTNGIMAVDSNHGPHNSYDLYEGNILSTFECDGYFGGASQETIFRNLITGIGTGANASSIGWALTLKRFSRSHSVVGNILGAPGYSMANDGTTFGQPNIGNGYFSGYGPPWSVICSNGAGTLSQSGANVTTTKPMFTPQTVFVSGVSSWWVLVAGRVEFINTYISPTAVTVNTSANYTNLPYILSPGTWGYQEMDTNVQATLVRAGNFNYFNNAIPAGESLGTNTLPASLYRSGKPAWFGNLAWPPIDPSNPNSAYDTIPAGYWFVHGTDPPGIVQPPIAAAGANPVSGLAPLAVTFSSAGSSDPGGATLTYSWAFGDGGTSTTANPSHTYQSAGSYSAVLTVSNGTNQTSAAPITITVTNVAPPSPTGLRIISN